jgi:DNA-binding IclR family transcriptional regulator
LSAEESRIPAATRTLSVLRTLAGAPGPMNAAAIARACEMPRSTTYQLLDAMALEGFVVHFPEERRWGLGVSAFEIGSAYLRHDPLERLARPILQRLVTTAAKHVPLVAHLGVLHGREVLYLLKESARQERKPVTVTDVGVRLPAHLTASGRALLAELPVAQVRANFPDATAFINRTGEGPRSLSQLRSLLALQRRRGYFSEENEVAIGFASVAAASLDHDGRPAAAISLTFRAEETNAALIKALVKAVDQSAAELSGRLRGRREVASV